MTTKKRPINVPMPRQLIKALDAAADQRHVSRSHVVRVACREWLRRQANTLTPEQEAKVAARMEKDIGRGVLKVGSVPTPGADASWMMGVGRG